MTSSAALLGPGRDLALALTAAFTGWAATLAWRGFTDNPGRFGFPLFFIALVIALVGWAGRMLRLSGWLVVPLQVVVAALCTLRVLAGTFWPSPTAIAEAEATLAAAADSATRYAAPVSGTVPPVEPLLVVAGVACLLVVDLLACTLRRVPLAGLPLLTVYTLPVSMLGGSVAWWVFALPAAGFVWLLYQHHDADLRRWDDGRHDAGRTAGTAVDAQAFGVRTGGVRATALGVGALATGLAVVVPLAVPTLGLEVFEGRGGAGDGDDEISLDNPMVDLRRDLRRPADRVLLRARTDDPDPSYLRISVLNRFSDDAWTSGDRDLPDDQVADGPQPPPVGVASTVLQRSYDWEIEVADSFETSWLPTPFPLEGISAPGTWKYDLTTRDFIAAEDDMTAAGLEYSATSLEPQLSAADLARAGSGEGVVDSSLTALSSDFPLPVRQLTDAVTSSATTDFGRAVALQDWFRGDGGFTYSLSADTGNGADDLVSFLSDSPGGRTGYCEQFASAMAAMARHLDIPARVAVGFLQPDNLGGSLWEYSSNDLHAWPELFFPGAGWVRFEPTPAGRAETTPPYTRGFTDGPEVEPDETEGSGGQQTLPELGGGEGDPGAAGGIGTVRAEGSVEASGVVPWRTVAMVAVVPLVLLLAFLPRSARRWRTVRRRRGLPSVEAAWAEVADVVVDHGVAWPTGRSPREIQRALTPALSARPPDAGTSPAVAALDRLARGVERRRYARSAPEDVRAELETDVDLVREAVAAGVSRRRRVAAVWLPRSLLTRRRSTPVTAPGGAGTIRTGRVIDRLA